MLSDDSKVQKEINQYFALFGQRAPTMEEVAEFERRLRDPALRAIDEQRGREEEAAQRARELQEYEDEQAKQPTVLRREPDPSRFRPNAAVEFIQLMVMNKEAGEDDRADAIDNG